MAFAYAFAALPFLVLVHALALIWWYVGSVDYEAATVNAVRAQQARVGELLRHFYNTTLPEVTLHIRTTPSLPYLFLLWQKLLHWQCRTYGLLISGHV